MSRLEIRVISDGNRDRLQMYHGGTHIGEYEHSIDKHVDAKSADGRLPQKVPLTVPLRARLPNSRDTLKHLGR